jgi:nitroimidazol reductase NimA-like FMN-containing flavoprotein (pyridoxamine 5'-phosphate oxidase superfamily)
MEVATYHPRRVEKDMPDRNEQLEVLRGRQFLTLAMCRDNRPYLVNFNYVYIEEENCFYVHSATEGRKLDYLRANPRVWGQVIEDRGYIAGQCSHAYRSVMFEGMAEFVTDAQEMRRALEMMIEQFETDPRELKEKLLGKVNPKKVTVLRIRIEAMSGKQSPPGA